jgi:hypothetical protein
MLLCLLSAGVADCPFGFADGYFTLRETRPCGLLGLDLSWFYWHPGLATVCSLKSILEKQC